MARVLRSSVYVEQPGALGAELLEAGISEETIQEEKPYALDQLGDHVWVEAPDEQPAEAQVVGEVSRVQLFESQNRANQLETENGRLTVEVEQLRIEVADLRQQLEAANGAPPANGEPGDGDQGQRDEGQREQAGGQPVSLPDNLDRLNKTELKELATERGVEFTEDDTNKQLVEKLKATEQ